MTDALAATWERARDGELGRVTSLLVSRGGDLLLEEYADGVDAETRHNTRSATKTVTGMLVGIAGGSRVLVVPDLELVVVVVAATFGDRRAHEYTDELVAEVLAAVDDL